MPDFRPATDAEIKMLRALRITQRLQRRVLVRKAIRLSHVRVARVLKALHPMKSASDLSWHAQITQHEASALTVLARLARRSKVFGTEIQRLRQRLSKRTDP